MGVIELNRAIAVLEKSLGVSVTIIDYNGKFRDPPGELLFSRDVQSHKKNRVCEIGFCAKCIDHCRQEMNAKCLESNEPFIETCWKGVTELVIPMRWRGHHLGVFYVGTWRTDEAQPGYENRAFIKEFNKLDILSQNLIDQIPMLQLFVSGLLKEMDELKSNSFPDDSIAAKIRKFISDNAEKSVQLEDLADHLELSKSRTSFHISKHYKRSFNRLINEERVHCAETLLAVTELKVKEIAAQVGFADEYHFNRVFKDINGTPPGAFRKLNK